MDTKMRTKGTHGHKEGNNKPWYVLEGAVQKKGEDKETPIRYYAYCLGNESYLYTKPQ